MSRLFASALIVLSLTACVSSPPKDAAPASDLDALMSGVKRNAAPRTLPNGKLYCVEDARTEGQRDNCALDLEDGFFLSEQDKARTIGFIEQAVARLKLARNPCGFWAKALRRDRCTP